MTMKKMTDRLEAVFTLIPKAEVIADIGTDHGYLAVDWCDADVLTKRLPVM